MALQYNPLENSFTTFEQTEDPQVELNLPLFSKPLDISDWSSGFTENGSPIVKPKTYESKMVVNNPQEQEIVSQQIEENVNPSISLEGNKKKAMDFFMSKGLKPYHAAGIVANLMGESGLNHTAVNPNSKAYGLAQWLGSRKSNLFKKYGNKPTFDQQLEFVWEELQTNERNAFDKLLSTSNYTAATDSFMRNFERPSAKEMAQSINKRLKFAKSLIQ